MTIIIKEYKLLTDKFNDQYRFLYKKFTPLSLAAKISTLFDNICPATTALPPVILSKPNSAALSFIPPLNFS